MKRFWIVLLLSVLCGVAVATAESDTAWRAAPVITQAYEIAPGELYLEWQGAAPVYQVHVDGEKAANTNVNHIRVKIKEGTHVLHVYPISEAKAADIKIELGMESFGNFGIDLAALGLNPKNLTAGTPSEPLNINYIESTIFNAEPVILQASTDFDDCVLLEFEDKQYSDRYLITIKNGKDESKIEFDCEDETTVGFIHRDNTSVVLKLNREYLQSKKCMVPEIDKKYTFSVQLEKYATNMTNGQRVKSALQKSKYSDGFKYSPTAAWKEAPVVTSAAQTGDGQIAIQWEHSDNGIGCTYEIIQFTKKLGITTSKKQIAIVSEKHYEQKDLMNDKYFFAVVPVYNGEKGNASEEITIDVNNEWVIAPELKCEQLDDKTILVTWKAAQNIECYHVTVYLGNNESVLRFANLDYNKYSECNVQVEGDIIEYRFEHEVTVNTEERIKFEVYGIHYAEDGTEQKSAVATQLMVLKSKN